MAELKKHQLTPEELIRELEARARGETALVILSINQWKVITEAYHSPLVENIANTVLQVFPQRSHPGGGIELHDLCQRIQKINTVEWR